MNGLWLLDYNGSVKGDKGKFFRAHATKVYGWSRGFAPLHVNFDSGCR